LLRGFAENKHSTVFQTINVISIWNLGYRYRLWYLDMVILDDDMGYRYGR